MINAAQKAHESAPKKPIYCSSPSEKRAYRAHFTNLGGVPAEVDTSGPWDSPRIRWAWVFPDGSRFVSDFARPPSTGEVEYESWLDEQGV